jgi:hypothetical protein
MASLVRNKFRFAFFLMAILDFCRLQAQVTESYFKDMEAKESSTVSCYVKYGNSIIIGGNAFGKTRNMPVVMRIDTLGNTLWNTGTWDTTYASPLQTNTVDKIMLGKDGFVYAYCTDSNTIWKLDPSNGTRLWKKKFPTTNYNFSNVLADYDATKLLAAGFYTAVAGFHYPRFAIISKATGDTISTHNMGKTPVSAGGGGGLPYFSITSDYQNNIYYSYRDTIVKVAGNNPNISIWKFRHATANAENYTGAHFDSTTASVFFLGYKIPSTYSGKIVKLSASTGSLLSSVTATTGDVRFRDMKVQNGYLYATWRHMYVGGGTYLFTATKYDMSAGAAVWSVGYSLTPLGAWDTHGGNGCGAMSIDVDNSGDVYLTGYHTDANYGPSQWGVMKLSGSNGSILWEKTIAEDTLKYNNVSVGMGAVVINNRPYFVGTLETYFVNYSERTKIAMVRMNPATGAVLSKTFSGSNNQFPSRTVSFTRRGISQTAVLKQEGRYVKVELYDFNRNLLWSKTLSRHYMLYAGQLSVDPSGTIMVSASSASMSNLPPFYAPATDSLHLFMINGSGQVLKEYQFVPSSASSQPIALLSENMSAYIYYTVNNSLRMRKATMVNLSTEVNLGITHPPALFNTNPVIARPAKLISFGTASGILTGVSLNKTSLTTTAAGTVAASRIQNVNFARALDSTRVLLCGNNNVGKEAVCLYNLTTSDTVWTRVYSNASASSAVKSVFNPARNAIYVVSTNSTNVVVRRFNASNGALLWSYTYAGAAVNQDDTPTDVAYDSLRNEILVSGYETALPSSKALMLKLDTNGISLDTIVRTGDFPGNCRGYCVSVLPDGTQWMGGNLNKNRTRQGRLYF